MSLEAIIYIHLKEKISEILRERLECNYVKTKTNTVSGENSVNDVTVGFSWKREKVDNII